MATKYAITSVRNLRRRFWQEHPALDQRKVGTYPRKDYKVDTRVAFVDWFDALQKDGVISEALASRATL